MTPAALSLVVLNEIDLGLVVCDGALAEIQFANDAAVPMLAAFGGPPGRLPAAVLAALGGSAVDLPPGRFARAAEVATPTGQRFFARAKRLGLGRPAALVVLTLARLRHDDLVGLLHRDHALSRRECECVALLRAGRSNREIAAQLRVTHRTIEQYLSVIYEKLGVRSRAQLVALVNEIVAADQASRGRAP